MCSPLRKSNFIIRPVTAALIDLPGPSNLSVLYNFGSLLGLMLSVQLITGIFLAMHYTPHVDLAFLSCIHIAREVNFGWLVRGVHANGASFFFFFMYLHVGRGLYYGSYKLLGAWLVGVLLFLATMGTAFLGYVLVWGQMSLWAATVITSLLSAIPLYGNTVVEWIWGGFSVSDATLHRFFVFHFVLPFVVVVLSIVHLGFLHQTGGGNPLGVSSDASRVPFHPYYVVKDVVGFVFMFIGLGGVVLLMPDVFAEPENFISANPLVTPTHIKPEWYFLWMYAILRAVPNKLGGVVAMFSAMVCLIVLPLLVWRGGASGFAQAGYSQVMFWGFVVNFFLLTWLGSMPAEDPYNLAARVCSVAYFSFFILFPVWNKLRVVWGGVKRGESKKY